jgi:two-component system sensor histidine kinase BaeS
VKDSPAKAFLNAQFHNYFIFTLLIFLLAFIMAIIVSRHLTKPIKQIVAGTNELTKGNFANRITPTTQDELGTLSNNVNELAGTLEQNRHMRYQWMSDTSHELRTPLTVLRSHLLAVQDGVFVADDKRINTLIGQVDNLNRIVDDIAQLSHSDTANLTYDDADIDLILVFEKTLESYTARFEQQALTVNSNALKIAEPCIVSGDKDRLQQLFANLLENTCRYTHEGGRVNIAVNKANNNVELVLQDSAPNVLPEDRSQLFERFYRVEKSRNRDFGGSGLGLALCKQIVEAHGGHISLEDSPLGGLAVKISLPLIG